MNDHKITPQDLTAILDHAATDLANEAGITAKKYVIVNAGIQRTIYEFYELPQNAELEKGE